MQSSIVQLVLAVAGIASASPVAAPTAACEVTPAPVANIVKRATSCTFSGSDGASLASVSQKSCSTIVLSDVAVPSGVTLDLSDLPDNTHVCDTTLPRGRCRINDRLNQRNRSSSRARLRGAMRSGMAL